MTNLFKNWPGEKIGVITDRISETNIHTSYHYYQLGEKEIRFPFPFNLIQRKVPSGEYHFPKSGQGTDEGGRHSLYRKEFKQKARGLLDNILKKTGLIAFFYKIRLSNRLRKWILDFNPDIIYVQPFLHRIMRFGNLLYQELRIPYAVHIMDDSISFINKSVIFRSRVQGLLEKDFRKLIDNASVQMCISEFMASEYHQRYGKAFLAFRNPIEVDNWLPYNYKDLAAGLNQLRIIYTGRLFSPTYESLIDMCRVVDRFNKNGRKVILDIFTYDVNFTFANLIQSLSGINLKKPVDVTEIPSLVHQYDIFFLCLDFNDYAWRYTQFSISTRTSEGMASSVPILMYGPPSSAQYRYFKESRTGYLVGERKHDMLEMAINDLWHNAELRRELSENALKLVIQDNNAVTVREKFRQALDFHP